MFSSNKNQFAKLEGWPKMNGVRNSFAYSFKGVLTASALAVLLASGTVACTSTEDADAEEVVDETGGDEEAATAKNGNAPSEEEIASEEAGGEAAIAEAGSQANPINAVPENTGMNPVGVDPVTNLPPEDPATVAAAGPGIEGETAAAPTAPVGVRAAGPGLPPGNNVVYVGGERAAIYDAPNGREVGRLTRGDFVLASAEGEWAKTSDGRFVRASDLQAAPIGRKKAQSRWRNPRSTN